MFSIAASGEEELSSSSLFHQRISKVEISLGLDLQGGIDMDLEVQIASSLVQGAREVAQRGWKHLAWKSFKFEEKLDYQS